MYQMTLFTDPAVTLTFGKDSPTIADPEPKTITTITEVICKVNATAGKPRFLLEYSGNNVRKTEILHEKSEISPRGPYFYGKHVAVMRLPSNGHLLCRVTDSLGSYVSIKPIEAIGMGIYKEIRMIFKVKIYKNYNR